LLHLAGVFCILPELADLPNLAGYLVNRAHALIIRDLLRQIRTSLHIHQSVRLQVVTEPANRHVPPPL
jgi:hypothetical protein